MELYFLSVGYGEAIVLLDGERCMVIDGGPGAQSPAYQHPGTVRLSDFLRQMGVRQIDLMLCTHLHDDHISGLADAAEQFPVREFWVNCWPQADVAPAIEAALPECPHDLSLRLFTTGLQHLERLRRTLKTQGTVIRERAAGADFEPLFGGCSIRLFGMDESRIAARRAQFDSFCKEIDPAAQRDAMRLFDRDENSCSLACCLELGGWKAMLTGDLCAGWDERTAVSDFPKAALLKLTHHGQRDGMPQSLVDACDPSAFIMCADADRTFRSACDEVQARARDYLTFHSRPVHVYTTGLLADAFGAEGDNLPCALCCVWDGVLQCTPFYME